MSLVRKVTDLMNAMRLPDCLSKKGQSGFLLGTNTTLKENKNEKTNKGYSNGMACCVYAY